MTEQTGMTEGSVPRRQPRIAERMIDDMALIVVLDKHQVHRLDAVGSRIWSLCDGRTLGGICDVLVEEFQVERPQAWADLCEFVAELTGLGALSLEPAP